MRGGGRLQFAQKGLPLILLVLGGSFGISLALQGKFDLKVSILGPNSRHLRNMHCDQTMLKPGSKQQLSTCRYSQ